MKPFFSIIIPCCNVEPYLRECLDSVMADSFADFECLLGVEESRDKTLDIARDYEAKDPRFKVFTGPRSGSCSASRNTGIDMAKGEYVIFLDGDDTIVPCSLQRLHDKIAERPGADLYPCAIQVVNEITGKNEELRDNYPQGFHGELTGPEATVMIYSLRRDPCPMLQMTVFRREHLTRHNLKCLHGRKRQDSEFSPRALYLAKRVIPLHEPFYLYRIRENSISMLATRTDYFLNDYAAILKSLLAFHARVSRDASFDRRISAAWARHWLMWLCHRWFSPLAIRKTPRGQRFVTLHEMFSDGFGDFDLLCRHATLPRRVAAQAMKLFARYPSLGWLADLFFMCVYNPLVSARDKLKGLRA